MVLCQVPPLSSVLCKQVPLLCRCGRLRTSALLRVDVAPLLLNHGLLAAAQQLYHMKVDMYLREGQMATLFGLSPVSQMLLLQGGMC